MSKEMMICPKAKECEVLRCVHDVPHERVFYMGRDICFGGANSSCPACIPYIPEPFKRYMKYEVMKLDDIKKYLTPSQKINLEDIIRTLQYGRRKDGKVPYNFYVVVKEGLPYTEQVWKLIEDYETKPEQPKKSVCPECKGYGQIRSEDLTGEGQQTFYLECAVCNGTGEAPADLKPAEPLEEHPEYHLVDRESGTAFYPVKPTCPECGHLVSQHIIIGCIVPIDGKIGHDCPCMRTPADLQPAEAEDLRKEFEMAVEVACCSECGNRGMIAIVGWEKDLCRACDAPTKLEGIVKHLMEVTASHDSAVASKAVKEFVEQVIVEMKGSFTEFDLLTIKRLRAMAEGKE
jgi:hypothetical protein